MAYEKLNLKNGDTLTEAHLQHLEEGIANAGKGSDLLDENGILKQEYLPEGFPYKSGEDVEILPSTTLTAGPESGLFTIPNTINTSGLSVDSKCVVRFEVAGEAFEYEVTAEELPENDEGLKWVLGNTGLLGDGDDTGEPFLIGLYAQEVAAETGIGGRMGASFAVESLTVSIAVFVGAFALIDPMYLPPRDPETIVVTVTGSFIVGSQQNNITATHTYDQIMELLNNGKNVALHRRDYESAQAIEIYTLSDFGYGKARFIHTEINNASVKCMQIQVCHSLTQYWEYIEVNLESLPSAEGGSF